jgi:hypothetical protein
VENDGHTGGVEQFDGEWLSETSHFAAAQAQLDAERLQNIVKNMIDLPGSK